MDQKLLELYRTCFSDNIRPEETVERLLSLPDNVVFSEVREEKLLGAAVLNGNTVLMLCVLPECRRQGIGSELLEQCEKCVKENNFTEIQLCDGPGYLVPGAPIAEGTEEFFLRRGYVHDWGDCECVDMSLRLADFADDGLRPGCEIAGVNYRWAEPEDREQVLDCVRAAHESFARYYEREDLYTGAGKERALLAECGGTVCGALLVSCGKELPGVGSAGCTAVRDEFRRRHIATNLVRIGTGHLKDAGMELGFIGYTYTDIVPLYGSSGYQVSRKYFMGKKALR